MKRYQKYKDSGAPWLGQIPSHWQVKKLKRAFSEISEKAKPGDEQLAATQKFGVISQSQFMKDQDQKLVLALKGTDNFKHLEKDDFVISLRAFEGGIERSSQSGCVSPAYTVLRSKGEVSPDFAARLLKTPEFISQISMTYDGIREGKAIKFKDAGPVPLPIPPTAEQSAITTFIDGVLLKMDSAIASQERMIELLKERRSAIITHAVTKGLDSKAKMKDSGVPWLGQVPAHWEVKRLRFLLSNKSPKGEYAKGEYVGLEDIESATGAYRPAEDFIPSGVVSHFCSGDILFGKLRPYLQKVALAIRGGFCSTEILALTPSEVGHGPYLQRLLSCWAFIDYINSASYGTKMPRVDWTMLADVPLPCPPVREAISIAEQLDDQLEAMNKAITTQGQMIELLKERRSAIITQAVTGQIDVR